MIVGDRLDRPPSYEERERAVPRGGPPRNAPELGERVPEVAAERGGAAVPRQQGPQVRNAFLFLFFLLLLSLCCYYGGGIVNMTKYC